MHAFPSCLRPRLILSSHLGLILPSGPILSEIPTKTVSAFPSCSIHATFHAKKNCLDFFIPFNLNENFNHEFRHYGILFSLLSLPSYWVHTFSAAPYSRTTPVRVHPWIWDSKFHTHIKQQPNYYLLPVFQFLGPLIKERKAKPSTGR
jgi:hypothetical protein